jgi:hypothetical protein
MSSSKIFRTDRVSAREQVGGKNADHFALPKGLDNTAKSWLAGQF